jgi:uncharacterized protein YggU (UPF0235/DUF167 family)
LNTFSIESSPFRITADGIRIRVLAHPGARRDAIEGLRAEADGRMALRVCVRAAAEGGRANEAIIALLAREWGIRRQALRLVSGAGDRRKSLHLSGEPRMLLACLQSWLRQQTDKS